MASAAATAAAVDECVECVSVLSIISKDQEYHGENHIVDQVLEEQKLVDNQVNDTVWELPIDMRFNDGHVISIVVYSILMIFSAVSNITVLVTILRYFLHYVGGGVLLSYIFP